MADTKLAILKAMINDALTELMVKTRIDNVFMTDKTTTLATKLAEIIAAINVREKIVDVDAKIEAAKSEVNQATKAEIDNITAADIGAASKEYVNEQIQLITSTGIPKLMVYSLSNVALEDNQTIFNIDLDTFDVNTDTVLVQNGRTMLSPNRDFTIEDGKVVLSEGVDKDRTVEIYVFKNVPMGDDGSVSGKVIAPGSLPLDCLEEVPTAESIGAATPQYVDQQIASITSTGIPKLVVYPILQIATIDGQTEFDISLDTFDVVTDTVLVQSGRAMLFPNEDFTIVDNKVVLNEGVPKDVTIGIYILKNVPMGEDGSVSGRVIGTGSLPLDRLEELPTAEQIRAFSSDTIVEGEANTDVDNLENGAWKIGANAPNLPVNGVPSIIYHKDWDVNFASQMAYTFDARIFFRFKRGGTWESWQTHFLPIYGGKLIGSLYTKDIINHDYGLWASANNYTMFCAMTNANALTSDATRLQLLNSNHSSDLTSTIRITRDNATWYNLFGEHNKPYGSYAGNGSTTSRTISTGGIGSVLRLSGNGYSGIVSITGGIFVISGGTVYGIPRSNLYYENGILYINGTGDQYNANGKDYGWECL